ncbi:MAG: CPBP family intramembrane metalloprotease [candidate division WOR-3 bacterium]|nr:MAG: CPBP family intramembrane metalloprotease [candidate division WOR-3 bacterium]
MTPIIIFELFLFIYNNVVNLLPLELHARIYVWLNLTVLLLAWLWARKNLGLTASDCGFTRKNLGRSTLYGLGLTALIILPAFALRYGLQALGVTGSFIRLEGFPSAELWWRVLVRIPLGTGLFEETLFRGIYYGYLLKHYSPRRAIFRSSLFFTFWHIMPALKVVLGDLRVTSLMPLIGLWIVGLAGAYVAGLAFAWLRHRTGNIAGCLTAHILINDLFLLMISLF